MLVVSFALAALCVLCAVAALRRGLLLWRRDQRFPKNLVTGMLYSRAVHDGLERAMLPLSVAWFFLGVLISLKPLSSALGQAHETQAMRWLVGAAVIGVAASGCVVELIIYFNRPRWLVPPFMRSELGITTAWCRRQRKDL